MITINTYTIINFLHVHSVIVFTMCSTWSGAADDQCMTSKYRESDKKA